MTKNQVIEFIIFCEEFFYAKRNYKIFFLPSEACFAIAGILTIFGKFIQIDEGLKEIEKLES